VLEAKRGIVGNDADNFIVVPAINFLSELALRIKEKQDAKRRVVLKLFSGAILEGHSLRMWDK
jgi:hypothetical protein